MQFSLENSSGEIKTGAGQAFKVQANELTTIFLSPLAEKMMRDCSIGQNESFSAKFQERACNVYGT